jgi:hypothetical protein
MRTSRCPVFALGALIITGLNASALNRMPSMALAFPADHPSVWRAHRRDNLLALARDSDRIVEDDEVANFLSNVLRFPIP